MELPDFILFGPGVHLCELNLLWQWRKGPLPYALWRKREHDAVFVCFSNFFLPPVFIMLHCLKHVAVMEVATAVISCGCGDFVHCGALSSAMCRVRGG